MPTIAPLASFVRPSMEVVNVCHQMVVARRDAWGMRLVQQAFSVLTDAVPVEGALKGSAPPAPVMSSVQTDCAWKILDAVCGPVHPLVAAMETVPREEFVFRWIRDNRFAFREQVNVQSV
jgi:hypothetical protein